MKKRILLLMVLLSIILFGGSAYAQMPDPQDGTGTYDTNDQGRYKTIGFSALINVPATSFHSAFDVTTSVHLEDPAVRRHDDTVSPVYPETWKVYSDSTTGEKIVKHSIHVLQSDGDYMYFNYKFILFPPYQDWRDGGKVPVKGRSLLDNALLEVDGDSNKTKALRQTLSQGGYTIHINAIMSGREIGQDHADMYQDRLWKNGRTNYNHDSRVFSTKVIRDRFKFTTFTRAAIPKYFNNTYDNAPPIKEFDEWPPVGSIQINGIDATTTIQKVTLNISATDRGSKDNKPKYMRIWNDDDGARPEPTTGGKYGYGWIDYNTTVPWTLTPGYATKQVSIRFLDAAGIPSPTKASDQIDYVPGPTPNPCPAPDAVVNPATTKVSVLPDMNGTQTLALVENSPQYKSVKAIVNKIDAVSTLQKVRTSFNGEASKLRQSKIDSLERRSMVGSQILLAAADTTAPTINITKSSTTATNGDVTLTATATDNSGGTGINTSSYSWSGAGSGNTLSITATANGTYTFTVKDIAGNTASKPITVSNIDKTNPTISITQSPPSTTWTKGNVTITATASDNSGGSGIDTTSYSWSGDGTGSALSLTATTNGTYTFTVKDKAGNTASQSITIGNIDKTQPTVTPTSSPDQSTWTNGNVTIYAGASDADSGINTSSYLWSTGATTSSITVSSTGTYTVSVKDKAGNLSATGPFIVGNIDKSSPWSDWGPFVSTAGWASKKTIFTTGRDAWGESGVKGGYWKLGSGSYTWFDGINFEVIANGTYTFKLVDNAGNVSGEYSITVDKIDRHAPTIFTSGPASDASLNKYDKTSATIMVITSDPLPVAEQSGLAVQQWAPGNFTAQTFPGGTTFIGNTFVVTESGEYTVYVKDNAGNAVAQVIKVSNIDKTPPTGNVTITGTGSIYTNKPEVSVNITGDATNPSGAVDGTTGACLKQYGIRTQDQIFTEADMQDVPNVPARHFEITDVPIILNEPETDGVKHVYLKVVDDLSENIVDANIILDQTPPEGSVVINGGAKYAFTTPFNLSITATDNLSGVAKIMVVGNSVEDFVQPTDASDPRWMNYQANMTWPYSGTDAQITIGIWVLDNAGNISALATSDILYDTTPVNGALVINDGAAETVHQKVKLSLTEIHPDPEFANVRKVAISNSLAALSAIGDMSTATSTNDVKIIEYPLPADPEDAPDNSGLTFVGMTINDWLIDTTAHKPVMVYAQYMDAAGRKGNIFSDDIFFDGTIEYVTIDHKQLINVGSSTVEVTNPTTIVNGTIPSGLSLNGWNTFQERNYLKYRIDFEVPTTDVANKMRDLTIELRLNEDNNDSVDEWIGKDGNGQNLLGTYVVLKKLVGGSFQTIKEINLNDPAAFRKIGRDKYEITIGKDPTFNTPLFPTRGAGVYALEYRPQIKVRKNAYAPSEEVTTIRNDSSFKIHQVDGKTIPRVIESDTPDHKFDIVTKITRKLIITQ